jgi:arginase
VTIIAVPYHLDERLPSFPLGVPVAQEVTVQLPAVGAWGRMAVLYERVAQAVHDAMIRSATPVVVSGDCTTSLGILAGLQRHGRDPAIVWFDAHADFHTEDTTTSGYLGGMPLALAVGTGTLTLPAALGLRPVPEQRAVLVDARDTDPGEEQLLARSSVVRVTVDELDVDSLPEGDLYLHLDADVVDAAELPGLLYPVTGGPRQADVVAAVERIAATGRVAAVGIGATWHHDGADAATHADLLQRLVEAVQPRTSA